MAVVLNSGIRILKQQSGLIGAAYTQTSNYSTDVAPYNLASLKRGTGGRSSFSGYVATVFGATGFLGRYVCNRLGKIGTQIIIPYRGDFTDVMPLKLVGDLGQVLFQPFDLRNETDLDKAVKYSNVVINLVGRDWETKNFKFDDVHVKGAAAIARAAKRAGVKTFIHVSALNAEEISTPFMTAKGSQFLSSKYHGERAVIAEFPEAIIFRPSDIYGQEDRFLRYYTHFWRRSGTFMAMWKKGEETIKQPVFVSDVAAGIINAMKDPDAAGRIYQAVGPKRYRLSDLLDWFYTIIRRGPEWGYSRYDMRYDPLFKLKVTLTERICPGWPVGNLHWERIEREFVSDVVQQSIPTLEDLGVCLTPMENQVPWELRPHTYGIYGDRDSEDFAVRPEPPKALA